MVKNDVRGQIRPSNAPGASIRAIYMCVDCSGEVRELISYALHTYTRDPELAGVIRQKIFSPTRFAPSGRSKTLKIAATFNINSY